MALREHGMTGRAGEGFGELGLLENDVWIDITERANMMRFEDLS